MESMHGRTGPLGSTTITAEIHGDAPLLRPRRAVRCRARLWSVDGRHAPEAPTFRVTFLEAAVWDVARIASKLQLRPAHDARARFRTELRFTGAFPLRVVARSLEREESPPTTAFLFGDERGRARRSPISVVSR